MVMGVHFALTGHYSWTAAVASLVPFFLVNNVLLLNQFPDVEADRAVGRRHFPILIGRQRSAHIYAAFLLLTYVAIVAGVALRTLPPFSLLALLTAFLAAIVVSIVNRNAENIPALIPALGLNVVISLATPALFTIGAFIR
jgi:1,4-dihydroxy-2-naphthoate octaprenyltransferase